MKLKYDKNSWNIVPIKKAHQHVKLSDEREGWGKGEGQGRELMGISAVHHKNATAFQLPYHFSRWFLQVVFFDKTYFKIWEVFAEIFQDEVIPVT